MGTEALSGEHRLHWLLGRLVHAHARLDLNIGLQLKWLGPYRGVEVEDLLSASEPFKKRVKKLRPLVFEMWGHSNPAAREAFEHWFERVERARALRNDYAHGRWGPVSIREPNLFAFVALSWEFDPDKIAPEVRITLDEFEAQIKEIELLGHDFMRLQKKFEAEGRWSKAWEDEHARKTSAVG
ncbi:hypothetical protein [Variovorax sp. J22R115]|uniref:hypothetical protein n=1 Tax=Variovorax sp. J22R115 TaxID=3053509 RepID=UPI0025778B79|nr:hypothetical protein [Variovorax sp. J22R115]MDM0049808.1 hypothetical protein [Variovorax sp. J22R115]